MADILFREVQPFRTLRLRLLLAVPPAGVTALAVWQVALGHVWGRYPMSNGGLIFLTVLLWIVYRWLTHVRLITTVEPGAITVRLTGLWRQDRIDLSGVTAAAPVTFNAVTDFGGYGWRTFKGGRAYLAGDTAGVRLQLRSGGAITIGTERPEELAKAIQKGKQKI